MNFAATFQVAWSATCIILLNTQAHLMIGYLKSKPLIRISLTDLISRDLVRIYAANFTTVAVINSILAAKLSLDRISALVLSNSVEFYVVCLGAYLSVGAVIQYAQVKLKTAELSENTSHQDLRSGIRFVVASFSVLINLAKVGSGSLGGFYSALTNKPNNNEYSGAGIIAMCGAASILTNVALRALIYRERVINDRICGVRRRDRGSKRIPLMPYIVLSFSIVMMMMTVVSANIVGKPHGPIVVRNAGLGFFCGPLPFIGMLKDDRVGRFVAKKLRSIMEEWAPGTLRKFLRARISPAYAVS